MNTHDTQSLPDDIEALKALVLQSESIIKAQTATIQKHHKAIASKNNRITVLEELVKLFKSKQFGKSSEKSPDQAELFDETEVEANEEAIDTAENIEAETNVIEAETLGKPTLKAGRKPLPAHLPRVRIEHDIPDHEKTCACGCQKTCIGEDTSEQLDIVPAVVQVIEHVRKKYTCSACEAGIVIAALPKQPIPKSNASPGLLAHIAVAKYQDGLPLYRMESIFKRLGIHLPRSTQANWMIKCTQLLQPLYNLLQDTLLASGYLHMDETTVQVLKEPDKPPTSKSYMWVRKTGDPDTPIVLFDYAPSRSAKVVETLLPDYKGYLQTDNYAGYDAYGKQNHIIHLGCMAHARRKFIDAQKAMPSSKNKGKQSKADMAVVMIKKLYAIEKKIKDKSTPEKYRIRQDESVPQLEKIKAWLDKSLGTTLPKGKTGEAIAYMHKNWDKLSAYTQDGRLNIDNNPVENAIRPFAIGRKNWMFSDSQAGAKASAMLYSIIETAKANKLEPYAYLKVLFEKLPVCERLEDYEELLPWHVKL